MKSIRSYKRRFNTLMESTMGNVKPLISENEDELGEGWLSNLFGGDKEEKKSSSSSDDDGPKKEYYKCGHLERNDWDYGKYYDKGEEVDVIYVSMGHEGYERARREGYLKQGSRYGGEACKGDLDDIFA